jgi:hypothetical protein
VFVEHLGLDPMPSLDEGLEELVAATTAGP